MSPDQHYEGLFLQCSLETRGTERYPALVRHPLTLLVQGRTIQPEITEEIILVTHYKQNRGELW